MEVAHCRWQADALLVFRVELVYNSGILPVVVFLIFDDRFESRLLNVYALVQAFLFLRRFLELGLLVDWQR